MYLRLLLLLLLLWIRARSILAQASNFILITLHFVAIRGWRDEVLSSELSSDNIKERYCLGWERTALIGLARIGLP